MLNNPSFPQPSLEGGNWKPTLGLAAPIVNSVESQIAADEAAKKKADETPVFEQDVGWLQMARNAYNTSENWLQANQRMVWARNLAHYRSEHDPSATIMNEANKHRSRHFWPKSRTLVRSMQASAASAFFSSSDIVELEAYDNDSVPQTESANFMKGLVDYRLTNSVPWYMIVLGAIAEGGTLGTICSHQSWDFQEEEKVVNRELDPETGEIVEYYETVKKADTPKVRLVPAENIRMSPALDWLDPANSTPYLIELMPMYLGDVLERIAQGHEYKAGEPAWKNVGEGILLGAGNRDNLDTTRRSRAGQGKLDPKAAFMEAQDEFRILWVHRNIIRRKGVDWLYYTVGTNLMLSDPIRLDTVIPWADGKRDYVIGKVEIETDRPYPSSPIDLTSGIQKIFNEIGNQRIDNVRQVLNRRYLYRQGNQVDARALARNVPGGLIGVSGTGPLSTHVEPLPVQDVTQSAYKETDMLGLSFDDLSGSQSGSTVSSNRKLQETATGMNIMADSANAIREMELKSFTKTWYEPVIKQIVQLIAEYETDTTAITVSAKKAKLLRVLPEYFDHTFAVSVKVGMGATSATQRMQRLQGAIATVTQLVPEAPLAIKGEPIANEVFGIAGFDNGSRFFDWEAGAKKAEEQAGQGDPKIALEREKMQAKAQMDQMKMQLDQAKMQIQQAKDQLLMAELQAKINLLESKTVVENVLAVQEASVVATAIAQTPSTAPAIDTILRSSGFVDRDAGTVVPQQQIPQQPLIPVQPPQQ